MSGINLRSIVVCGIVAGLVANAFDLVIPSYLMEAEFSAMLARLNLGEDAMQRWICVFAVADFAWGLDPLAGVARPGECARERSRRRADRRGGL